MLYFKSLCFQLIICGCNSVLEIVQYPDEDISVETLFSVKRVECDKNP